MTIPWDITLRHYRWWHGKDELLTAQQRRFLLYYSWWLGECRVGVLEVQHSVFIFSPFKMLVNNLSYWNYHMYWVISPLKISLFSHLWFLRSNSKEMKNKKTTCQTHLLLTVIKDCEKRYRTDKGQIALLHPPGWPTGVHAWPSAVPCSGLLSVQICSSTALRLESTQSLSNMAPTHRPLRLVLIKQSISYIRVLTHAGVAFAVFSSFFS